MKILSERSATPVLGGVAVLCVGVIALSGATFAQASRTVSGSLATSLEVVAVILLAPLALLADVCESIPDLPQPFVWALFLCGLLGTVGLWAAVIAGVRTFVLHRHR